MACTEERMGSFGRAMHAKVEVKKGALVLQEDAMLSGTPKITASGSTVLWM